MWSLPLRTDGTAFDDGTFGPWSGERHVCARIRRIIDTWARTPNAPTGDDLVPWVRLSTMELLKAWPTAEPTRTVRVKITGGVNRYLRRFVDLGSTWRYAGDDIRSLVRTTGSGLSVPQRQAQNDTFHRDDRRLAWWTPDGLILDEVRAGKPGDERLDRWMQRKVVADLSAGRVLAAQKKQPFLGVRVLPLVAHREAIVVTGVRQGEFTWTELAVGLPQTFFPGRLVRGGAGSTQPTGAMPDSTGGEQLDDTPEVA